jgi:hypothetical protein
VFLHLQCVGSAGFGLGVLTILQFGSRLRKPSIVCHSIMEIPNPAPDLTRPLLCHCSYGDAPQQASINSYSSGSSDVHQPYAFANAPNISLTLSGYATPSDGTLQLGGNGDTSMLPMNPTTIAVTAITAIVASVACDLRGKCLTPVKVVDKLHTSRSPVRLLGICQDKLDAVEITLNKLDRFLQRKKEEKVDVPPVAPTPLSQSKKSQAPALSVEELIERCSMYASIFTHEYQAQ